MLKITKLLKWNKGERVREREGEVEKGKDRNRERKTVRNHKMSKKNVKV